LVSGYSVLATFDAVKQWCYKPYQHSGENVEVKTVIKSTSNSLLEMSAYDKKTWSTLPHSYLRRRSAG